MSELIVIILCLAINAAFAAFEMGFVSLSRGELKKLARQGNKSAETLLKLRDNPERTLSVIQIGITLVGALSAAVGGAGAADWVEPFLMRNFGMREPVAAPLAIAIVVLPLTFFSVVIGELVPKTLALRYPSQIALAGVSSLVVLDRVLKPIVGLFELSTNLLIRLVPRPAASNETPASAVDVDHLTPHHRQFILNLADLERKNARFMMVPWSKVNFVRQGMSLEEVAATVFSSMHTRMPVVSENQVVGLLHTKEFVAFRESGSQDWQTIVRPVLRVHYNENALALLRMIQEKHSHLVLVVGDAGEVLGIVTLEDILEEVVGDLYDEDDDGNLKRLLLSRNRGRLHS